MLKQMIMEKAIRYLIFISVVCFIFVLPALGDQPPDPGGDPTGEPVGGAPIGGGLFTMVLAGLIYGVHKLRMAIKK